MILENGKFITGSFLIEKISFKKDIAEIEINDDSNKLIAVLKNNIDVFIKNFSVGQRIICQGKIREIKKKKYLDVVYISKNMLEINKQKKIDVQGYTDRFYELILSVSDKDYKKILDTCFNDDVKELFFKYPAAQNNHHNYKHGLLQHTIEVVDISIFLAQYFENINQDLLICSGLLHDIGKLKTYEVNEDLKIEKNNWEKLLGHLPVSALFLPKITHEDCNPDKLMLLYHCILSHHGRLEWGSPIKCKTKEAFILHKADEVSSALNKIELINYDENNWSEKNEWFGGKI